MALTATEDETEGPSGPAVLVVDDNAAKRLAVRAMLAPLGHA